MLSARICGRMPKFVSSWIRHVSTESIVADAAKDSHLGGIPRAIVVSTIGAATKIYTSFLSSTSVENLETLTGLIKSRPKGTPLLTVSNHMSTLDDPLMWGLPGISAWDHKLLRWILAAEDICFTNPLFAYFFRLGKCIPVKRGAGIYQPAMSEALARINEGEWLHTFPQGKVVQDHGPLSRLKWGIGSLIARAAVPPIVLPLAHSGFEKAMPEKYMFGRRPPLPLVFKKLSIVVGQPMRFDIPELKQIALAATGCKVGAHGCSSSVRGRGSAKPAADRQVDTTSPCSASKVFHANLQTQRQCQASPDAAVLDEKATKWMYSHVTDQVRMVLQELVEKARKLDEIKFRSEGPGMK